MSYSSLRRQVTDAGLLERTPWNYTGLALITLALGALGLGLAAFAPGWWCLLAILPLTQYWIQVGFFGHDAGHNQVFARTKRNLLLGFLCYPLTLGMSFRPWVIRHNKHHAETNIEGDDPDLENRLVAFTEESARDRRGILRWIVIHQGKLYPLLGCLATLGFRLDAWRYIVGADDDRYGAPKFRRERRLEAVLLCAWIALWVVLPTVLLGPLRWLPIFLPAQLLFGFHMSMVFAPNHKGMETFSADAKPPFLEWQVLTSRNVRPSRLTDFMYGGLNYQIEHHLFPTMSRHNLGRTRAIVRAYCAQHDIPYVEESVPESVRSILRALDQIGQLARRPPQQVVRSLP
ncbi:MAG TPA: acyl-CoA desaturase [Chloroflexota bacterium]